MELEPAALSASIQRQEVILQSYEMREKAMIAKGNALSNQRQEANLESYEMREKAIIAKGKSNVVDIKAKEVEVGARNSAEDHGSFGEDDVLASVQPLPTPDSESTPSNPAAPEAAQRDAGAFAVQSFRIGPEVAHVGTPASGNAHLVEAQLVEEGQGNQGELVLAEEIKCSSKRCRIINVTACVFLATLVVAAICIAMRQGGRDNNPQEIVVVMPNADSTSDTTAAPAANQTATASEFEDYQTAYAQFKSIEDLYSALDSYFEDYSSNSSVVQEYGPIGTWSVSNLHIFQGLFNFKRNKDYLSSEARAVAKDFAQDIGEWNMSSAQNMEETLRGVRTLSATWGIDRWDTSSMTSLKATFMRSIWNKPQLALSSWDTSQVVSMNQLFRWSNVDHPNVSNWNTSSLQDMELFAGNAEHFNDNISNWNTERVTTLHRAFQGAIAFDMPIGNWNVATVTDLRWAFQGASSFNQNLCAWGKLLPNTTRVLGMFEETACPNKSDPILPHGPFCYNCY